MGLDSQSRTVTNNRGPRRSFFKDGVRYKHMSGAAPILFRILPAFNPENKDPATSYLPCITPDGKLTDFGAVIHVAKLVGHGQNRQDLLSLKTFQGSNENVYCPLVALLETINAEPQTWGYLVPDGKPRDKDVKNPPKKPFGRPSQQLVSNIFDVNAPQFGTQLGVFTPGTTTKIIDRESGFVFTPNSSPNVEELAATNYLYAYANGDITDPNTGPVLQLEKGTDRGEFSAYTLKLVTNERRQVQRRVIDTTLMAGRINLSDFENFVDIPTAEDLVQALVSLFNGRSPEGYHEYSLLRLAFPQFQIPDPPQAAAATSQIPSGFAPAPSAPPAPPPPAEPSAPAAPAQGGVVPTQTFPWQKQAEPAPAAPAAPPTAAPAAAPVIPGTPLPEWNRDAFMATLRPPA